MVPVSPHAFAFAAMTQLDEDNS
eukprot:COSAG05_NODE_18373_length_309_cov_0.942857_2_plen_22_part_01